MSTPKLNLVRNGPVPVYEQIANYLRAQIAAGTYQPGQKLPGIKVLAKTLGINHLTMREALRHLEKERVVVTESARGTFVATNEVGRLHVALVLPNLNESSSRISAGVQEVLAASKSNVNIFHYDENPSLEREHLGRLRAEGYDGAIVFPSLDPLSLRPLMQMLIEGYPLVFLDRGPGELPFWSAWADNLQGGYLATKRLIEDGCRRIACVATGLGGVSDRFQGYLRALGDHGLPVDYTLVRQVPQHDEHPEQLVDEWLQLPEPPDGIFFTNDFQAIRGMRQLVARGQRVPEDVKVIGFDDLSICGLSTPALTTISQDFAAIGQAAARLLEEQVSLPREKRFGARHESVPVKLVVRGSA
ncbi:MAG TPA: GntR family transcriptional regulator [Opitutaceae bacterium]